MDGEHRQRRKAYRHRAEQSAGDLQVALPQADAGEGEQTHVEQRNRQQGDVADVHPGFGEQPAHRAHDQQGAEIVGDVRELEAGAGFRLLAEEFQQALVLAGLQDAGADGAGEVLGIELEGHGGAPFPMG
ncbi:hypothetical protein FQZ97_1140290 [compost metagenome]